MNRFILILSAVASHAVAQPYPSKPIHLIVPFAPGGSSEFVARTVSSEMAKGLGQNFVIENKPGGGGNIAMQEVARAVPVRLPGRQKGSVYGMVRPKSISLTTWSLVTMMLRGHRSRCR